MFVLNIIKHPLLQLCNDINWWTVSLLCNIKAITKQLLTGMWSWVITMVINPIKNKSHTNLKCDLQTLYKLFANTLLVNLCSVHQQTKKTMFDCKVMLSWEADLRWEGVLLYKPQRGETYSDLKLNSNTAL